MVKDLPKNRVLKSISTKLGFLSTQIVKSYQKLDQITNCILEINGRICYQNLVSFGQKLEFDTEIRWIGLNFGMGKQ